jgi:uncharacterized protein YxjI
VTSSTSMQPHAIATAAHTGLAAGPFAHARYTIKRPFWSFMSRRFMVYGPDGSLVMFVKHPMLRLRDEWKVFADEGQTQPLLTVKTREVIAINRTTDIRDARSGELVGTLRSRGLRSLFRDTWDLLDSSEQPYGLVTEDSNALLRRFIPLLTGKWHVEFNGQVVAVVEQVFRFFTKEFTVDMAPGQGRADPRLIIGCAMLALMREIHREEQGLGRLDERMRRCGGVHVRCVAVLVWRGDGWWRAGLCPCTPGGALPLHPGGGFAP